MITCSYYLHIGESNDNGTEELFSDSKKAMKLAEKVCAKGWIEMPKFLQEIQDSNFKIERI